MTIQILELTNEDIDAILPLENELYHKPWLKKDYEYELNENPFAYYLKMIDKDSNEIRGYIGFWIKFEYAEITKVSIAKKYQGYKLSKLLMNDAERRIRLAECVNITLEVRVSNTVAINLYKSCGFNIVATRKKYYENGEDAYLMLKEF
jgi:ribosomal-protein-alanine N-acetyltransferase